MAIYSDCVICGKSTLQIQSEAVTEYLRKTAILGESADQLEAKEPLWKECRWALSYYYQGSVAGCRLRWQRLYN